MILKVGQYLVNLWARVRCLVLLTHGVGFGPLQLLQLTVVFSLGSMGSPTNFPKPSSCVLGERKRGAGGMGEIGVKQG